MSSPSPSSTEESATASTNPDPDPDRSINPSTTARREMTTQHTDTNTDTDSTASFDPDAPLESDESGRNRRRAILAVIPFLAIGLGDLVLILGWGIEPLWAFAILPPILFCSALAYIVFSTDFLDDRT
jgi:hypothetical protein